MTTTTELPVACDMTAIPAAEWAGHTALARRLFGEASATREGGVGEAARVDLAAGALDDLAAWVKHERLCCPFLRFTIDVSPAGGALTLTLSGPVGTRTFLEAELGLTIQEN